MYKTILVPLDGSSLAEQALAHAEAIARGVGAEVLLLQVISLSNIGKVTLDTEVPLDFPTVEQRLKEEYGAYLDGHAKALADQGLRVRTLLARGGPALTILDILEREKVDLCVLTSHGHSGLTRWVHGSTAQKVIDNAPCPVLLIRAQGG